MLSALAFVTPWALAGLLALPVIWWLLRFTPPKPELVRFPPVRILLDLVAREEEPDKTPWWLLLLRLALAALVILGVSHPLYAPGRSTAAGSVPVLLVVDDSWAAAKDWKLRQAVMQDVLERTGRAALAATAPALRPADVSLRASAGVMQAASALQPKALDPDRAGLLAKLRDAHGKADALNVVWLSDGLDHGGAKAFAAGLAGLANGTAALEVFQPDPAGMPLALTLPRIEGGRIKVSALRLAGAAPAEALVKAVAQNGRTLAEARLSFAAAAGKAEATLDLPLELRNEVARVELGEAGSAAGVFLFDDRWRRKTIGLKAGANLESAQPLLSPLYYVSRALEPYAELTTPDRPEDLQAQLTAGLSMLVLADIGVLGADEARGVQDWLEKGGVLLRFAGPRLAGGQDDLIPVRLREGGRELGSALSWETPQALQGFAAGSPFAGLTLSPDIQVVRQVLAEPDADLQDKVWASLADGTPLVTAEKRGKGLLILFHVTANADWSNLPLSGLFVDMLRRVLDLAPGAGGGAAGGAVSDATAAFMPRRILSADGLLGDPPPEARPVLPRDLETAKPSPEHPAGLYARDAAERAINLSAMGEALMPLAGLPASAAVKTYAAAPALPLAPILFSLAFLLFLADCLVALWLSGGMQRLRMGRAAAAVFLLLAVPPEFAGAQEEDPGPESSFALENALQTKLGYVLTGDSEVDEISQQGLKGLGTALIERTSVEPGEPVGLSLASDELVFFPLIYWPVLPGAEAPSETVLARINAYMKNGGTLFFDLRDDGFGGDTLTGGTGATTLALRRILDKLDIPALQPVPEGHVLTKAFYLLEGFPGRYDRGQLWVEAADSADPTGSNADGVTTILIGSNDYAAAWALDSRGEPLYAAVPGGDRQRELAFRSGINIVMYALTGNYKADQVHVPALLERLGQ